MLHSQPIKAQSIWNAIRLRKIGRIFSTKIRHFKLRKMAKIFNFTFPKGCYFLNCDKTELKRSSKIIVSVSERHRWAVVD